MGLLNSGSPSPFSLHVKFVAVFAFYFSFVAVSSFRVDSLSVLQELFVKVVCCSSFVVFSSRLREFHVCDCSVSVGTVCVFSIHFHASVHVHLVCCLFTFFFEK